LTWTEDIRPLLEQTLRLVDKQPTDWTEVEQLAKVALTKIPVPALPISVPFGKALGVEESPAAECRDALTECLELLAKQRHSDAVSRLQDAWQAAEQNEGL
jgi:hypothetical protein